MKVYYTESWLSIFIYNNVFLVLPNTTTTSKLVYRDSIRVYQTKTILNKCSRLFLAALSGHTSQLL